MIQSAFYEAANRALSEECGRLLDYTAQLDEDQAKKTAQMAEYKCAMYRYAAISNVHSRFQQSNRLWERLSCSHYVIAPLNEALCLRPELLAEYEQAADKKSTGLYLGAVAYAEQKIAECQEQLSLASDWEAVELTERLGGYRFALRCLHNARKETEQ